jgi:hypothetical protein
MAMIDRPVRRRALVDAVATGSSSVVTPKVKGTLVQILPKQPSAKGPAEMFTGDVWFDVIAKGEEPSRTRVNIVRFSPCARTARHSHPVGQTLHVTEGVGPTRRPASGTGMARPGSLRVPPRGMGSPRADSGRPETDWGDHVTDEEYTNPPASDGL